MEIPDKKKKKEKLIRKYTQYLQLERGLSPNTVEAYLTDLDKLLAYLTLEDVEIEDVKLENLRDFAAGLRDIGIHARSQARILSGVKSFFRFLLLEDYLPSDPSELLEAPNLGFHLPEVLTVEEIDRIIGCIDLSTKEGQRNRAILETLYSCGLRVSELTHLKLSELYLEDGFIQVEGKRSKQRLVPISPRAIREISLYMQDRNQLTIQKGYEDYLFLTKRGKNISRIMVFHIIKVLHDPAIIDEPAKPVRILAVRIVKMIPNEIGAVCLALNSERIRVDVSNGYGVGIQSPQRNVFLFQRIVNGLFAFVSAHYDYLLSVA